MKTLVKRDKFAVEDCRALFPKGADYYPGLWPATWVSYPDDLPVPFVTAYRRSFSVNKKSSVYVHVTADERYSMYLDGSLLGRGPDRGDAENWFVDTYVLDIPVGNHVLTAIVWSGGRISPAAQIGVSPGLLVAGDNAEVNNLLGTGVAEWEVCHVNGVAFESCNRTFGAGGTYRIDAAAYPWGVDRGDGAGWRPVRVGAYGLSAGRFSNWGGSADHQLRPSTIPAMIERPIVAGRVRNIASVPDGPGLPPVTSATDLSDEHRAWNELLGGKGKVTLPANTRRRVLVDLDQYYCAYERVTISGGRGAQVRVGWAEGLYEQQGCGFTSPKGNRDVVEGKYFMGIVDTFLPDGGAGRAFEPLWWRAGRYVEIDVTTAGEPLTIESLRLAETRYPLDISSSFRSDSKEMMGIMPIMTRALEMCSHEIPVDCPYYEQLMYEGDTRLQALVTMCLSKDDRLVRKAIEMFAAGRTSSGLLRSNYPSHNVQVIPGFSLWWCCMVYDFAMWRGDATFVKSMIVTVRDILEVFTASVDENGLHRCLPGWNYCDWASSPEWGMGVPPGGRPGEVNAPLNWHLVYTLRLASQLEAWLGDKDFAARWDRRASQLAAAATKAFWDDKRGLFADDSKHRHFSEHAQCLALLSGAVDKKRSARVAAALVDNPSLVRTTIYFSHYLFETYRAIGRIDKLLERMSLWYDHADSGMKTTREWPEPTRSDCHGWGAHPLYHYYASIAGIRPADFGFEHILVQPQLGALRKLTTSMVHPKGRVVLDVRQDGANALSGTVTLPTGTSGTLVIGKRRSALHPGKQKITSTSRRGR